MKELVRTTDPVFLSWLVDALEQAGIDVLVLDTHTSILEGSIGILPRRVMVVEEDQAPARAILEEGRARARDGAAPGCVPDGTPDLGTGNV